MKAHASKQVFQRLLGNQLQSLTPEEGIRLMLDFYRSSRADRCVVDEDGDMLLYQWGTYDWGQGEFFELNITRQFIEAGTEDPEILQLSLTFRYRPTANLRRLGDNNQWCNSPNGVSKFALFIRDSEPMRTVGGSHPDSASLTLEDAC